MKREFISDQLSSTSVTKASSWCSGHLQAQCCSAAACHHLFALAKVIVATAVVISQVVLIAVIVCIVLIVLSTLSLSRRLLQLLPDTRFMLHGIDAQVTLPTTRRSWW